MANKQAKGRPRFPYTGEKYSQQINIRFTKSDYEKLYNLAVEAGITPSHLAHNLAVKSLAEALKMWSIDPTTSIPDTEKRLIEVGLLQVSHVS